MLRYVVLNWILNKKITNNSENKSNNNQGFTLAEMLVTAIVVGILSAIAIPSFVGLMSKNQVQEATDIIQTALKEVQKEAMAKSINCELRIDGAARTLQGFSFVVNSTATVSYPSTTPSGCLSSSYSLKDTVNLYTNSTPTTQIRIRYSYKGNASSETTGNEAMVVISATNSSDKKCVVVPNGVGIVRTCNDNGANNTATTTDCSSSN